MTGQDLHQLLLDKWGVSYDVQLRKQPKKVFFQVMWRYLEQASFPMDDETYAAHLSEVASYLDAWGAAEQIQTFITETSEKPRLGKAVSIPVDLGSRASEGFIDS